MRGGRVESRGRIGFAGFKLRILPNPPVADKLFGNTYLVNRTEFAKRKDLYGKMFAAHIGQADKGCDFDFLAGTAPIPEPEIH